MKFINKIYKTKEDWIKDNKPKPKRNKFIGFFNKIFRCRYWETCKYYDKKSVYCKNDTDAYFSCGQHDKGIQKKGRKNVRKRKKGKKEL